jgi:hypothetical protein
MRVCISIASSQGFGSAVNEWEQNVTGNKSTANCFENCPLRSDKQLDFQHYIQIV